MTKTDNYTPNPEDQNWGIYQLYKAKVKRIMSHTKVIHNYNDGDLVIEFKDNISEFLRKGRV